MATYYWDPFTGMEAVRREMERLLQRFEPADRLFGRPGGPGRLPLMNVAEDAEHVHVEMLAPGLDPESIEVSVLRRPTTAASAAQAVSRAP